MAIIDVTIVDGTGAPPQVDRTVIVDGGAIAAIGPAGDLAPPPGARIVRAEGRFLIPGLWDMHAHLYVEPDVTLPLLLANGVTGVRDMGSDLEETLRLKEAITSGRRLGPRIVTSGPIVDGVRDDEAEYRITVADHDQATTAVASLARRGADFVKVYHFLDPEAYRAVTDEARRRGMAFAGHVPRSLTPLDSAELGQASIEHLSGVLEYLYGRESLREDPLQALLNGYAPRKAEELFRRFSEAPTWHTPTLESLRSFAFRDTLELAYPKLTYEKYLTRETRERWERDMPVNPIEPSVAAARTAAYRAVLQIVEAMHRAGVGLLAGTDHPIKHLYPGFSLHDELARFVDAGLTPMEALRTATHNPARFLGLADALGTIEMGKRADLVLLDANPLEDIRNTRRVHAVIVDGNYLGRDALDELLQAAASAAEASTP